ncbi:hypothetical protein ACFE04_000604 [Oxalis oulophora]
MRYYSSSPAAITKSKPSLSATCHNQPPSTFVSPPPHKHRSLISTRVKWSCACSPTTHPGSFRCALHRSSVSMTPKTTSYHHHHHHHRKRLSNYDYYRKSAIKNSLMKINGVLEKDFLVKKKILTAVLHHQRCRLAFVPRLSRLSNMSKADDDDGDTADL